MNRAFDDGYGGYLVLAGLVLLAHEPWRWLGLVLGRNLGVNSPVLQWVRAVATALVSGLVMKLVLFPAGMLAEVPAWERLAGLAVAAVLFFASGRWLAVGVGGGALAIAAMEAARLGW